MCFKRFYSVIVVCLLSVSFVIAQEGITENSVSTNEGTESDQVQVLKQQVEDLSNQVADIEENQRLAKIWKKGSWVTLSYVTSLTCTVGERYYKEKYKSSYGFSLSTGHTYYLNSKPIVGMIKFGIDATWFNITYAKFNNINGDEYEEEEEDFFSDYKGYYEDFFFDDEEEGGFDMSDIGMHHLEIGMGIGPSVTVNPIDYLKVAMYLHYMPTFGVSILDEEVGGGYISNWNFGFSASYKAGTIGFEWRWGSSKYKSFSGDEEDIANNILNEDNLGIDDLINSSKHKTSSFRIYLGLRF